MVGETKIAIFEILNLLSHSASAAKSLGVNVRLVNWCDQYLTLVWLRKRLETCARLMMAELTHFN